MEKTELRHHWLPYGAIVIGLSQILGILQSCLRNGSQSQIECLNYMLLDEQNFCCNYLLVSGRLSFSIKAYQRRSKSIRYEVFWKLMNTDSGNPEKVFSKVLNGIHDAPELAFTLFQKMGVHDGSEYAYIFNRSLTDRIHMKRWVQCINGQQFGKETLLYISKNWMTSMFMVKPHMNIEVLKSAFRDIVGTNESLRMGFTNYYGLKQSVFYDEKLSEYVFDIEADINDVDTILERYLYSTSLHEPPLTKMIFIRSLNGETYLIISFHHLIMDGIAVKFFFRNFAKRYQQYNESAQPKPLLKPKYDFYSYIDFMEEKFDNIEIDYFDYIIKDSKNSLVVNKNVPSCLPISDFKSEEIRVNSALSRNSNLGELYQENPDFFSVAVSLLAFYKTYGPGTYPVYYLHSGRSIRDRELKRFYHLYGCLCSPIIVYLEITHDNLEVNITNIIDKLKQYSEKALYFSWAYYNDFNSDNRLSAIKRKLRGMPYPTIFFNYVGDLRKKSVSCVKGLDMIWTTVLNDSRNSRAFDMEFLFRIDDEDLVVDVSYNPEMASSDLILKELKNQFGYFFVDRNC